MDLLASAVYGYDTDKRAISIATCLLLAVIWQACIADGIVFDSRSTIDIPDFSGNLVCADFLHHRTGRDLLAAGGVDVILGGPPFVRIEQLFQTQRSKIAEYRRRFRTAQSGQFDLYMLFIEKALQLLRPDGQLAMSLSSSFLRSSSGRTLRHLIARQCHVREIVQFACDKVYPNASVQIALLHLQKLRQLEPTRYVLVDKPEALWLSTVATSGGTDPLAVPKVQLLPATACGSKDWNLASGEDARVLHRIDAIGTSLSDLRIDVRLGACTGADEVFLVKACDEGPTGGTCEVQVASGSHVRLERAVLRPVVRGRNLLAWCKPEPKTYCICPYDTKGMLLREAVLHRRYPLAYRYLLQHRELLDARCLADAQAWYSFRRPSLGQIVGTPKLLAASIGSSGFTIDTTGLLCHNSVALILLRRCAIDPYFVLGILNSQLFRTYIQHKAPCVSARGHCLRIHMLRQFPLVLPRGTISNRTRDQISLRSRDLLRKVSGQPARQMTDPVLDQLVWRLYGIPGHPSTQKRDRAVSYPAIS